MFHSRLLNSKINRLHERALRIVYKNENLTFQELLNIDESFTIHHRNLQKLAIEMYKVKHNLSSPLINDIFKINKSKYELRNARPWDIPFIRTVAYGTDTIRYHGTQVWELVPKNIKESKDLSAFRNSIRNWKPTECKCRLCKIYIFDLGFLG